MMVMELQISSNKFTNRHGAPIPVSSLDTNYTNCLLNLFKLDLDKSQMQLVNFLKTRDSWNSNSNEIVAFTPWTLRKLTFSLLSFDRVASPIGHGVHGDCDRSMEFPSPEKITADEIDGPMLENRVTSGASGNLWWVWFRLWIQTVNQNNLKIQNDPRHQELLNFFWNENVQKEKKSFQDHLNWWYINDIILSTSIYSTSGFLDLYSFPSQSAQNLWNRSAPIPFDANVPNPSRNCLVNTDALR